MYSEQFDNDREELIKNTLQQGVSKILLPNIDRESLSSMMELSQEHPNTCYAELGLHPCSVAADYKEVLAELKELLERETEKFIGIGEIGIDLYWDKTYVAEQREAFKEQCLWALEKDWAIAIHVRDSFNEVFECLDELNRPELKGIFHCFGGSAEQARKALSYPNFKLGIGGVVTFKNSKLPQVLAAEVPMESLVLETDAPYLTPHPYRGKRNSPEYIPLIAEKLSEIYRVDMATIGEISSRNCYELYPQIA